MREILKLVFGLPGFKKRFAVFVLAVVLAQGVAIQILPFVERAMIEVVEGSSKYGSVAEGFTWLILAAVVATTAFSLLMRLSFFMAHILQNEVWHGVFNAGFEKLIYHDLSYLASDRSSGILNKVTRAAYKLADIFTESASAFFRNMTRALVSLGILFYLSWQVGLGVLGTLLAYMVIYYLRFVKDRPLSKEQDKLEEEDFSRVYEVVPQAKLVKIYTNEEEELGELQRIAAAFREIARRREWLWNWAGFAEIPLVSLPTIGLTFFAAWQAINGVYGIPTLVLIISMIRSVQDPMWVVNWFLWEMQFTYDRAKKYAEILASEVQVKDPVKPEPFDNPEGEIKFEKVTFQYKEMKEPILKNFSASFPGGKVTALVGKSGVGKTTITNLICRFFDPSAHSGSSGQAGSGQVPGGRITIGGRDVSKLKLSELRGEIGFVLQESYVFSGTVLQNMRYARQKASCEEVEQALRQAGAWEFVSKLPEGIETQIGERGVKLSGGQKQRLSIAMMILKDPSIVILDEATNALDSESEVRVQKALEKFMRGRTVVVVAHRLSTVQQADQILLLGEGKVQEKGTHEQLVAKGGIYAKLWAIQSGGYEEEKKLMESYELG